MSRGHDRGKEQQRRSSDAGRQARRMYNQQPEVRQRKAIRRAIKRHQAPPAISFGAPKPPVGVS